MSVIRPYRYHSDGSIESKAEKLLKSAIDDEWQSPNKRIDPSLIAEYLGLDVIWDRIPSDGEGEILALIKPMEKEIEIQEKMAENLGLARSEERRVGKEC